MGCQQNAGYHLPRDRYELDRTVDEAGDGMKVLITGICGFVGSSLVESLLERHENLSICGIDNLMRPGSEMNRSRLHKLGAIFIHGDIRVFCFYDRVTT